MNPKALEKVEETTEVSVAAVPVIDEEKCPYCLSLVCPTATEKVRNRHQSLSYQWKRPQIGLIELLALIRNKSQPVYVQHGR